MKRHKKIYYTPGLISLVFLPLLILWHLNKEGVFNRFSVIEINIWSPDWEIPHYSEPLQDGHPKRNYTQIRMTGHEQEDNIKLSFAQLSMRELKLSEDVTEGIHIHFGDSSKYWALVKAIDICTFEQIKSWTLYKNELWIFNLKKDPSKTPPPEFPKFVCGYYYDTPKVPEMSLNEIVLFHLSRFYPLFILFILLTLTAFIKVYRQQ